jgi:hypothetical protein
MELSVAGSVLTLTIDGKTAKCVLPKGERGAPGRDGISLKGEKGEKGDKGADGRDGRDSTVPGEKGEQGQIGARGAAPQIQIGKVSVSENGEAYVHVGGTPEYPILDFVLPRGLQGYSGRPGEKGKDGSHEVVSVLTIGNSPKFYDEYFSSHLIADGVLSLPECKDQDMGRWFCVKTLTHLVVENALEGTVELKEGESAKFVCVPYGASVKFTAFK